MCRLCDEGRPPLDCESRRDFLKASLVAGAAAASVFAALRPKLGASVSWPASMIERRMPRVRVNSSNSLSPSLHRIAR